MNASSKTTFTLAEAAELLSCHRETLRRAIRSGELRAAKLGRGFRISRIDLEAFWTMNGGGDLFTNRTAEENAELALALAQAKQNAAQAKVKKELEQLTLLPIKK